MNSHSTTIQGGPIPKQNLSTANSINRVNMRGVECIKEHIYTNVIQSSLIAYTIIGHVSYPFIMAAHFQSAIQSSLLPEIMLMLHK